MQRRRSWGIGGMKLIWELLPGIAHAWHTVLTVSSVECLNFIATWWVKHTCILAVLFLKKCIQWMLNKTHARQNLQLLRNSKYPPLSKIMSKFITWNFCMTAIYIVLYFEILSLFLGKIDEEISIDEVSKWTCQVLPHVRQTDSNSCGVFVIKVCLRLII